MKIFTDSPTFAADLFPAAGRHKPWSLRPEGSSGFTELEKGLFPSGSIYQSEITSEIFWEYGFLTEHAFHSQYEMLLALCRKDASLPLRFFCLAGAGENFHGQRKRPWVAEPGNLHLTVFFRPEKIFSDFFSLFPSLAAVSVLEAIDRIAGLQGQAQIKWVNDIVIGNAKVAGFLAHSQCIENEVKTAVLGIGVNVLTVPDVKPDPFTPGVTALAQLVSDPGPYILRDFLTVLLERLLANYNYLLQGRGQRMLEMYRKRSIVIGKQVSILSDPVSGEPVKVAAGRVVKIGENLELYLENEANPVRSGRLIIE